MQILLFSTLPGLGFFENLRLGEGGEGLVGPRWRNMLFLKKYLSILHESLQIYCFDNME